MPHPRRFARAALVLAVLAALAGCSPSASSDDAGPPPIEPGTSGTVELGDRSFLLAVPEGYDPKDPPPLVVALHGYTQTGSAFAGWFGLTAQAGPEGFLLAIPEGTQDGRGQQFWNATSACCDFDGTGVDDSAYLSELISTVTDQYAVDPTRVAVVGHSNGGFMALRMACDHADQVTVAVSVAGEMADDASSCTPAKPVSVLQVQGDADEAIHYDGGTGGTGKPYPGAEETVQDWRTIDGCDSDARPAAPADYESTITGAETDRTSWSCRGGTEVGLWTIHGAKHSPSWGPAFATDLAQWLVGHPRGA